ncbi:acyl dehydratase [Xanthobacter flavus]|uniref:3-alpha,7-alpha, 12-alpha-trihydroxy-5-beta-cholest-24-enoyl-CoA hydratase n=1 Tax=Xanthobacter flavus TaxID=281 RepID=A0A9W6CNH6_XANFL|nr:MaoC/PaaZ C-terminal domain-containing protein [Xanthobacter flavus]MDR6335140.1 acyl dehydratase [Xanthobacter flavus]GLI23635.1 3-alpha,7-alpha,12-alpha-trihydroxy-5-beta-cholest-24-enoyl-CoA hydratase [Xanthobacter flavus]
MAIDYEKLVTLAIPDVRQTYTARDTMLYALGVGLGHDPTSREQLRFVYEKALAALPTMAVVLASPGSWMRDLDTGIDYVKVVHGEQGLVLHRPLPVEGTVVTRSRVVEVIDKGAGKGAVVVSARELIDVVTGERIASITQSNFCRGDGGFGGPARPTPAPHKMPERSPDVICELRTNPNAALTYRLSGDYNPLHSDPDVAAKAGFPQPILHGLATYGVTGHAILKSVCDYDPTRLRAISARFTAPVFPGETFAVSIWRDGSVVSFETRSVERSVVAIGNGRAEIA